MSKATFALLALFAAPAVLADAGNELANKDLVVAAARGDLAAIASALDHGADIDARIEQYTALDVALDYQRWTAAEQLLDRGARLAASATGTEHAVRKLLDLEPVLKPDTLTLVQTVEMPSPALFRAVLAQGASTSFTDDKGNSPLLLAAKRHHVNALQALLAAGLDVNARNAEGDTALAIAAGKSEYELMVIGVGLALGQTRDSLMKLVFRPAMRSDESAATARRLEAAKLLLAAHADPNSADSGGNTPLLEATRSGDVELVSMLIAAGASVDVRNTSGAAPILMAAQFGLRDIAGELVAAHADLGVKDNDGHTPVEVARAGGHAGVVQLLEQAAN